jgi:hypothetical protein
MSIHSHYAMITIVWKCDSCGCIVPREERRDIHQAANSVQLGQRKLPVGWVRVAWGGDNKTRHVCQDCKHTLESMFQSSID